MQTTSRFDIQFLDQDDIRKEDPDIMRNTLRTVFDASIPWEKPQYDCGFQDYYFDQAGACVIVRDGERPVALSIGFPFEDDERDVLYIAGIWVDDNYKSHGLGKLIIRTLIECGFRCCFEKHSSRQQLVTLRTQNPQVYEYFDRHYDVFPSPEVSTPNDMKSVAELVHQTYSSTKEYNRDELIVRRVFPEGIIVGHLHPARSESINNFFEDNLDIHKGDSYILVMQNKY